MGVAHSRNKSREASLEQEISEIVDEEIVSSSPIVASRQQEFYAAMDLSWIYNLVSVSARSQIASLLASNECFTLIDALTESKNYQSILFASNGFSEMSGYSSREAVGQNCNFLRGTRTLPDSIAEINVAIKGRKSAIIYLINYCKDDSEVMDMVSLSPIYNNEGEIVFFKYLYNRVSGMETSYSIPYKHENIAYSSYCAKYGSSDDYEYYDEEDEVIVRDKIKEENGEETIIVQKLNDNKEILSLSDSSYTSAKRSRSLSSLSLASLDFMAFRTSQASL